MFLDSEKGAGLLRYELYPGEPVDGFAFQMIRENTPDGVLLLGREKVGERECLLLPVAGLVPLFSEETILVNNIAIDKLFSEVRSIQNSLCEYMIPAEELVLRPEWTWVRPETGAPVLLVLPTPSAKDLSLSMEEYEALVRAMWEKKRSRTTETEHAKTESAKRSARRRGPAKPWRQIVHDYWENLD